MSIDLRTECYPNDLVLHRVFFDMPDPKDKTKTIRHIPHQVAGFAKVVKPSYIIIYCPYLKRHIRIQRAEVVEIIPSLDDMRRAAKIIGFPPPLKGAGGMMIPKKKLIITPADIAKSKKIIRL